MSLTPRQLRAIRRRRQDADADAEARQHARLDALFGLEALVEWLPHPIPIGWRQLGKVDGGLRYCFDCAPTQPTDTHTVLHASSYLATMPCLICGRRLDAIPRD